VPALGVAGRYYTDGSMAKSMERALQVADSLVADLRPAAAKSAAPKSAPSKAAPAKADKKA
jgi:hypothetical protein